MCVFVPISLSLSFPLSLFFPYFGPCPAALRSHSSPTHSPAPVSSSDNILRPKIGTASTYFDVPVLQTKDLMDRIMLLTSANL